MIAALSGTGATKTGFDSNKFSNDVKQDGDYTRISKKIIMAKPSAYNRVMFVCWFSRAPLTSGDIQKALTALGLKMSLPDVSRALKKNLGKFLTSEQRTSGGTPPKYKLTAPAEAEFEAWLKSNEKQ